MVKVTCWLTRSGPFVVGCNDLEVHSRVDKFSWAVHYHSEQSTTTVSSPVHYHSEKSPPHWAADFPTDTWRYVSDVQWHQIPATLPAEHTDFLWLSLVKSLCSLNSTACKEISPAASVHPSSTTPVVLILNFSKFTIKHLTLLARHCNSSIEHIGIWTYVLWVWHSALYCFETGCRLVRHGTCRSMLAMA